MAMARRVVLRGCGGKVGRVGWWAGLGDFVLDVSRSAAGKCSGGAQGALGNWFGVGFAAGSDARACLTRWAIAYLGVSGPFAGVVYAGRSAGALRLWCDRCVGGDGAVVGRRIGVIGLIGGGWRVLVPLA